MPAHRQYSRISHETRARIIQAFECGEDWRLVARMNGVKYHTAYAWLRAEVISYEPKKRGGFKKRVLSEPEIDNMLEWIAEDPTVTLERLRLRVKAEFDKEVSVSTIGRYLDGRFITSKKVRYLPVGTNSQDNKDLRRRFVIRLLEVHAEQRVLFEIEANICSSGIGCWLLAVRRAGKLACGRFIIKLDDIVSANFFRSIWAGLPSAFIHFRSCLQLAHWLWLKLAAFVAIGFQPVLVRLS